MTRPDQEPAERSVSVPVVWLVNPFLNVYVPPAALL